MLRFGLVFFGLAVLVAIPFAIWGDALDAAFADGGARTWLEAYGPWAWAIGIGLLIADLLLPVPGTAVMAALGIIYGPWLGGLIGALGSFLSGCFAYGLCRAFGQRAFTVLAGNDGRQEAERLFAAAGGWLVAGSRWLPVLPETVACIAGMIAMDARRFGAALACGVLPLAFTFAWVGHLGADAPLATLLASALAPLVLWALFRAVLTRRQA